MLYSFGGILQGHFSPIPRILASNKGVDFPGLHADITCEFLYVQRHVQPCPAPKTPGSAVWQPSNPRYKAEKKDASVLFWRAESHRVIIASS